MLLPWNLNTVPTFLAKYPFEVDVSAFAYGSTVSRDAYAAMLTRIVIFTCVCCVSPDTLQHTQTVNLEQLHVARGKLCLKQATLREESTVF